MYVCDCVTDRLTYWVQFAMRLPTGVVPCHNSSPIPAWLLMYTHICNAWNRHSNNALATSLIYILHCNMFYYYMSKKQQAYHIPSISCQLHTLHIKLPVCRPVRQLDQLSSYTALILHPKGPMPRTKPLRQHSIMIPPPPFPYPKHQHQCS